MMSVRLTFRVPPLRVRIVQAARNSRSKCPRGALVRDGYARVPSFTAADVYSFSGDHQPDTVRPFFASLGQVSDGRYLRLEGSNMELRFTTTSVHGTKDRTVVLRFDELGPVAAECSCPQGYVVAYLFCLLFSHSAYRGQGSWKCIHVCVALLQVLKTKDKEVCGC
jgi:hypothetical protein